MPDTAKLTEHIEEQIKAVEADYGQDWELVDFVTVLEVKPAAKPSETRARFYGALSSAVGMLQISMGRLTAPQIELQIATEERGQASDSGSDPEA